MFNFIRSHQRWMQVVLLVLILPSFVLIGVSGYNSFVANDEDIVEVNGTAITSVELDREIREQLAQMQRQYGADFDPAIIDTPEARAAILNQMVDQRLLFEVMKTRGLTVSDETLRNSIGAIADFHDENGEFSRDLYYSQLEQANYPIRDFEAAQRSRLAMNIVLGPIAESVYLPSSTKALFTEALNTGREIQIAKLEASAYLDQIEVDETAVQAWYEEHKNSFMLPQYVDVEYLVVDEQTAKESVGVISEADLQSYYEQNLRRYSTPARAQVRYILLLKNSALSPEEQQAERDQAQALAQRLQTNPDQFAEVAKSESDDATSARDGGRFGWVTQPDDQNAGVEQAIFKVAQGEVTDAVEDNSGYHIFYVEALEPEVVPSFEALREQLEEEVRTQLAAERFADMVTELTNLTYEHADSLQESAAALGLSIQQAQGIARDSLVDAAILGEGANAAVNSADAESLNDPRVRRALFGSQSLEQRQNAGVIELSSDKFIAIRASEVHPEHVPELAQIKAEVTRQVRAEKARALAVEKGEEHLAALLADQEAIPTGVDFSESMVISRLNYPELFSREQITNIFSLPLKSGSAALGLDSKDGYVIVRVVGEENNLLDPQVTNILLENVEAALAQSEEVAALKALRKAYKVKELPALPAVLNQSFDE